MNETFLSCRRAPAPRPLSRERGISLVVAIVFLLLMAVLALAGLRGSTTNIQIVGNMQARQEAVNTAQALLETVISTGDFATNPTAREGQRTDARSTSTATARPTSSRGI